MAWIGRILGSLVSFLSGFAAIGALAHSRFGGSLPGFVSLVAGLLLGGFLLGYVFTRLGRGSVRRSVVLGLFYATPPTLFTFGIGHPAVVLPVLPLLFASCVLGGWAVVRRRGDATSLAHPGPLSGPPTTGPASPPGSGGG